MALVIIRLFESAIFFCSDLINNALKQLGGEFAYKSYGGNWGITMAQKEKQQAYFIIDFSLQNLWVKSRVITYNSINNRDLLLVHELGQ